VPPASAARPLPESGPAAEAEEPVESEPAEELPLTASGLPSEGPLQSEGRLPGERLAAEARRERVHATRRRKQHGLLYRWVAAYLPLVAALFALLGLLLVYETFFRPPTPAERWQQITDKWSPPREAARTALSADTLDFVKQLDDYKKFYDATKGWVDDVSSYTNWAQGDTTGAVQADVNNFLSDSQNFLDLLQTAANAKTADEIVAMQQTLPAANDTWNTDVALVRVDLGLSAVPGSTPPLPLPSLNCVPVSTGSPGATESPLGSPTPTPSGSVAPTLPPCPAPTSSPGATYSPSPSPSESPSPSPSPSPSAS
jgi:hypothetical protein